MKKIVSLVCIGTNLLNSVPIAFAQCRIDPYHPPKVVYQINPDFDSSHTNFDQVCVKRPYNDKELLISELNELSTELPETGKSPTQLTNP